MPSQGTVVFRGQSGVSYRFQVWPLGTPFKPLSGVCIVSKRTYANPNFTGSATHECLHIGEMADLSRLPYEASWFKQANCVCVYLAGEERHRLAVQEDLARRFVAWNPGFQVDFGGRPAQAWRGEADADARASEA